MTSNEILELENKLEVAKARERIEQKIEEEKQNGNMNKVIELLGIQMQLIEKNNGLELLEEISEDIVE